MRRELRPALERGEVAGAERQLGAPALPPRDQSRRREVAGRVAEGEAVVGGAALAEVHGERHDGARRHRVQAELVTRRLKAAIAARSPMPQLAPQRPRVSNSGPSQRWSPNWWTWRQASGHCVQARILVRTFSSCGGVDASGALELP